jgi:hypothetical protein
MKENHDSLNSFQSDYKKLAELCAETNNHLVLKNIYIPSNKFEYEGNFCFQLNRKFMMRCCDEVIFSVLNVFLGPLTYRDTKFASVTIFRTL